MVSDQHYGIRVWWLYDARVVMTGGMDTEEVVLGQVYLAVGWSGWGRGT